MKKTTISPVQIYDLILKNLNLKPGDKVKVTHKVPSNYLGWNNTWVPEMNSAIGKTYIVYCIHDTGVELRGNGWIYPPHCLEVVERAAQHKEIKISSEYTAQIYPGEKIVVDCQTIDKATFEKIVKAFNS